MATELYAVAATTVAAGGYTAGSGVLNVTTTASPFPSVSTGVSQMHLLVYRVVSGAITTIVRLKATNTNSGTQWAVVAESADTNALAGDLVACAFTPDALDQIRTDSNQIGTFANIPTVGKIGMRYRCSDAPYEAIYDGSSWRYFTPGIPFEVTPPPDISTLTAINFNSGGFTATSNGTLNCVCPKSGTTEYRGLLLVNAPSRPYTFTIGIMHDSPYSNHNFNGVGAALAEASPSTKFNEVLAYHQNSTGLTTMTTQMMTSPTVNAGASDGVPQNPVNWTSPFFLRWVVGTSYRMAYFSLTGREGTYMPLHTNTTTAWNSVQTPARVGVCALNYNTSGATCIDLTFSVFHWKLS